MTPNAVLVKGGPREPVYNACIIIVFEIFAFFIFVANRALFGSAEFQDSL